MKTVNKDKVCEQFGHELDEIERYLTRCKEVFREDDLYLSYSYENAILMVYRVFETFIKRIIISCLNHDHSAFEEKYSIALGRHINDDVCEFLITKGGYFDFKGYGGLISILHDALGHDHALIELLKKDAYQKCITRLCAAGNYAAHSSKQSKMAVKKAFQLQSISSAGSFLKQQNRLTSIVSDLRNIAAEIKTTNIY